MGTKLPFFHFGKREIVSNFQNMFWKMLAPLWIKQQQLSGTGVLMESRYMPNYYHKFVSMYVTKVNRNWRVKVLNCIGSYYNYT